MSIPDDFPPPQSLRTMQIIAGAMLLGVAFFFAIVLFIVLGQGNGQGAVPPGGLPLVSIILMAFLIVNVSLSFLVPGLHTRAALKRIAAGTWQPPSQAKATDYSTDGAKLFAVRQTSLIMSLAFLEGTAFFGCIAYLLEHRDFVLGIILILVLLMVSHFPTQGRVRVWLEQQADRLAELRQQAGYIGES